MAGPPADGTQNTEVPEMLDLIYVGIIVVFFVVALAYIAGCDRLKKGAYKE